MALIPCTASLAFPLFLASSMAGYRGRLGGFVFNFFLSCMDGSICMHTGLDLLSFFLSFFLAFITSGFNSITSYVMLRA